MLTVVLAAVVIAISCGLALSDPPSLVLDSAIYDSHHQRMVVFGGSPGAPSSPAYSNTCWALALDAAPQWDSIAATGTHPSPRVGHASAYDPVGDQMIVFGGYDGSSFVGDVWSLSLSGTPAWNSLQPLGTGPTPRSYCSAVYDPMRDRVLVFGGRGPAAQSDVWSLRLRPTLAWEPVVPHGTPPPARYSHSAVYDGAGDRMLVFGGFNVPNDVWLLTLGDTTWVKFHATGVAPVSRLGHAAICDPVLNRMIVFGGTTLNSALNDAWSCSLAGPLAWSPIAASGTVPSPRRYLAAIYDSTYRRMALFGGESNISDPTWVLSMNAAPRWSPFPPVVQTSVEALQFPSVTRGDMVSLPLTILNAGLQRLDVNDIRRPAQQVNVNGFAPSQLAWSDSVTLTVSVVAGTLGHVQDSLVVVTSDPETPRKRVLLDVDVREFEFDTRAIGIPELAPLGVALNVVVTPKTGTRIDRGALYFRVTGSTAAFDSLVLAPLAADFIATIPAASVTEQGLEYYVRVEHNGYAALQPATAPATLFVQSVAPPASMTAIPQSTSGAEFLAGRDIRIESVLPLGASFVSGTLHYRRGGESDFASATLAVAGQLDRPSATIPGSVVGSRGIEYWVGIQTLTSTLRFPAATPAVGVVPVRIQNLVEPAEHAGGRYRLLSVPLDFGVDFSSGIDALLTDQFGAYDLVHWRMYFYDPGALANIEFSPATASQFRPSPGRAFWLITRAAHRVDTRPIDGTSTATGAAASIALKPGWNLFGNPFDFPVAWSSVRHSAAVGAPVAFDPSAGRAGDYAATPPAALQPFEGYFIENTASVPETLWVPPQSAPAASAMIDATAASAQQAPARASDIIGDIWRLRLRASTESAVDGANEFGVNAAAAEGRDALDLSKPPLAPGSWVRVAFAHPEWGSSSAAYRHDLRAPGADGEIWEIEVRSESAGEQIMLELADLGAAAPGLVVRLVDRELGSVIDAESSGLPVSATATPAGPPRLQYRLVSYGSTPYRLAIVAGSRDFALHATEAVRLVPVRFTVEPNAPNPFRFATRIRFGLAHAHNVSAEVYSVTGQRVVTLLDRTAFAPGYHSVVWDGTTGGVRAASGIYLLRISAGGETLTRHLVFVR